LSDKDDAHPIDNVIYFKVILYL